ncbi:MAG TPA: LLM class flavin-dependent oxidoreductase [Acidimicrobiia bacterium]|jgi:alkanesulfonate monooxygenase|nr:LLM class flavin-dependent oxidoreductase [Acidimicrobiia bacterium]
MPGGAPLRLHWFLPTGGDARDVLPDDDDPSRRPPDLDYLAQIAVACDSLGFDGMLTPCGTGCEDAWLATAALIPLTKRVKFLVAFRPALLTPTLAAQMASTYQRLSGGRLLVNIVTGAEPAELARFGVFADKETRYARTGEFVEVMRGAWSGEPFDYQGEHFTVEQATTRVPPDPIPRIYFGGASDAAERVAAHHVDVYLAWGEPPDMVSERVARMRALAAEAGRTLDFGIRFHVIARPTADEAWAAADALLAHMDPNAIAAAQRDFAATQSVGQARMAALHGGDADRLVVYPNVWAGIGLVRGGVGTALVGSYDEVADRIAEYHGLGFDEFILSGYPHLEEAYWFGEGVMPRLRERGLLAERERGAGAVFSFR